ncbi:unnamed protein product [Closterium sp. Naga37s-1]|nr:unnamed protein product [Closterium sp. Naga37s-1]
MREVYCRSACARLASHSSQLRYAPLSILPLGSFPPISSNPQVAASSATKTAEPVEEESTMLRVIISGAPASGKGTQCEEIVKKYGLAHISTGDLLRDEVACDTENGRQAKAFMDAGQLVPDDLVISMVQARLSQPDARTKGWLLDGFPRSPAQAQALMDAGVVPDVFLLLQVPDSILVERVVGRRLDPHTNRIYHLTFSPPESEEVRARLIQRSDDTEEKALARVEVYKKHVTHVVNAYREKLVEVNGHRGKHEVFADISSALDKARADKEGAPAAAEEGTWRGMPTRLNDIPHSREIRQYFYDDACSAAVNAVAAGKQRIKIFSLQFPLARLIISKPSPSIPSSCRTPFLASTSLNPSFPRTVLLSNLLTPHSLHCIAHCSPVDHSLCRSHPMCHSPLPPHVPLTAPTPCATHRSHPMCHSPLPPHVPLTAPTPCATHRSHPMCHSPLPPHVPLTAPTPCATHRSHPMCHSSLPPHVPLTAPTPCATHRSHPMCHSPLPPHVPLTAPTPCATQQKMYHTGLVT